MLDENLAQKLKFIKEGQFVEKDGVTTLKLVGDVVPIDKVEVIKRVRENLTKSYPLSAMELANEVQSVMPTAKQNDVWRVVKENGLKVNLDYSAYNFRNKGHEDTYKEAGFVPSVTPSLYNSNAVDLIVKILRDESD